MKYFWNTRLFDEATDGNQGGGGNAFDPAAFRTEILTEMKREINAGINGATKSLKTDLAKTIREALAGNGQNNGQDGNSGNNGQQGQDGNNGQGTEGNTKIDPAVNARMQAYERKQKELETEVANAKKAREEAEGKQRETSRQSTIRDVLAGIEFRDETARRDAYKSVVGDIKFDDDGNLVADTSTGPVSAEEYIKGYFGDASRAYMLAPKGGGGSGAKPGTKSINGYVPRITDDPSKLTPEQLAVWTEAVGSSWKEALHGTGA